MQNSDFAKAIAVAVEVAGYADRGLDEGDHAAIREQMLVRDVADDCFEDIVLLVDAFRGFAMNVRAAVRKSRPIIPVHGETDLPS